MDLTSLNYARLHYFWTVAREGGVTAASRKLHVAPSTVSGQLRLLEAELGAALFAREGRQLVPTAAGRTTFRYADRIFSLGRELGAALRGEGALAAAPIVVGLVDAIPKPIVWRLLGPALGTGARLVCREGRPDRLGAELESGELDLVLSDAPATTSPRFDHHLLEQTTVSVLGAAALAAGREVEFPRRLDGAPFVLPLDGTPMRRAIDRWFERERIRPHVVAEFEDGALLYTAAQSGAGLFLAPTTLESDLRGDLVAVGRVAALPLRYYAITLADTERRPGLAAMLANATRGF